MREEYTPRARRALTGRPALGAGGRGARPSALVVSPGSGAPARAGVSPALIRAFAGRIPVLGVCLGHQAIGEVFGGVVERAPEPVHGKTSWIRHDGRGVFAGLPAPFEATRYHSLVVRRRGACRPASRSRPGRTTGS